MSDEKSSAISEALPEPVYVAPQNVDDRPNLRRKIEERTAASLANTEVLALILGAGNARAARRILQRYGIAGIEHLAFADLRTASRAGPAGVARLAAALELHRRLARQTANERPKLSRPMDVYREVRDIRRARKEHLVGLYLDSQNGLVHRETLSVGSLNTTRTHPREILFPAIQHVALGFILVHNHPSGCLDPSSEDVEFTRAIRRAGELMGIELYDHLIVAGDTFTSMRERGLL
jgi:DNA repair protein RadC